jgi:hypothetical protein
MKGGVSMFRLLAAALLALAAPLTASADAVVDGLKGTARAGAEPVTMGQRVADGSEINTGPDSRLVLAFDDGGKMVLEQNTRFRLVSFRYQRAAPAQDHAVFDLLRGALRVVTGALAGRSREVYAMRTPQVTIGVRGTDFMVAVLDSSYVNVISGQVAVTNGGGTAVFGAGSIASAVSNAALAAPISASALPPAAAGAFSNMGTITLGAGGASGGAVAGTAIGGTGLGVVTPVVVFGAAVVGAAGALKSDDAATTTHH